MKHLFGSLFFLICLNYSGYTQELNLVSTSGTYSETASGSVSWSIGEVVIVTGTSGTNNVTQGFHQSNIWVLGIENLASLEISIFPNPTCEFVNIVTPGELKMSIYDMGGRLISVHNLVENTNEINVSELSRGTYNLVFESNGNISRTAQLVVQ